MWFKSARQCQRFVSMYDPIANFFHLHLNRTSTAKYRNVQTAAMLTWRETTVSIAT